ncbi:MAG: HmuY family protein [Myxococcota bacterium]
MLRFGTAVGIVLLASTVACEEDPDFGGGDATTGGSPPMDASVPDLSEMDAGFASRCMMPAPPACQDEAVQALSLRAEATDGVIVEEGATPGEQTLVDATGGGFMTTESYLYARFTDSGLVKVDISDEQAFEDMTWDIAFRRFLIRLNGGVSGPSCVRGSRTAPGTTFDDVTSVDPGLTLMEEAYLTDGTCELINDGSGLPNAPATVLASFWQYPGCVQMTGTVFVVELADGRTVKLEVLGYYDPDKQEECQMNGSVTPPTGSGNVRIRWAFI